MSAREQLSGREVVNGRLGCMVPFCRRTVKCEGTGRWRWVCGAHWRMVDRRLRNRYAKIKRILRSKYRKGLVHRRADEILDKAFNRCAIQAVERAGGIA